jgi:hypothetical protein
MEVHMHSRWWFLVVSSLLIAAPALAGTTQMSRGDVSSGTSDKFRAKKSTKVEVKGTIVPKGKTCLETVPSVDVRLERRIGGKGSSRYDHVEGKNVPLNGSVSVPFKTQGNADGVYRITWIPKPIASGPPCKFDQALTVSFEDPEDASNESDDDDEE